MKLFYIFVVSIAIFSVFRWWNTNSVEIVLPTPQQLNEMVGREGIVKVPLPYKPSGN